MNSPKIRNRLFYAIKPIVPRRLQVFLRRQIVKSKLNKYKDIWPIDPYAGAPPFDWKGWPEGKNFALVLSHDVDTQKGHDRVSKLMEIEAKLGFKSSFNFVPERYKVSQDLVRELNYRGFQVCVHGLKHDGKLFNSKKIFNARSKRINHYLKTWQSIGFTSPCMHHNLEWMHMLDILHSTTTFDTDPFEPQPDGIRTIFPFWVSKSGQPNRGFIELPYTLPQDHLLFVIMQHTNIDVWKKKLSWIVEKGGMALLNTHSDYMGMNGSKLSLEEYPIDYYIEFLEYVKSTYKGQYWHGSPRELVSFLAKRSSNSEFMNKFKLYESMDPARLGKDSKESLTTAENERLGPQDRSYN